MTDARRIEIDGNTYWIPPLDLKDEELLYRQEFLRRCMQYVSFNEITGDYAEFGCASARTFRFAYDLARLKHLPIHLWAFDSFEGLPERRDPRDTHPKWVPGVFPTDPHVFRAICDDHGMSRDCYTMVPGFYTDTLGPSNPAAAGYAKDIAIANIDCDMHSSTADVLAFLAPRLKTGMILYFDDYYCYANGVLSGERHAMLEFLQANPEWHFEPWQPVNWHGMSFIAERRQSPMQVTSSSGSSPISGG